MKKITLKSKKAFLAVFIIISFLFLVLVSSAQQPPEQEYTYEQFKKDFSTVIASNNDVETKALVQKYPVYYAKQISEEINIVEKNPAVYEEFISLDIKYLNQNRDAFKAYASTKGVNFENIEGQFKSYDKGTGRFVTKGPSGESVVEFDFKTIELLKSAVTFFSGLTITKEGKINYLSPQAGGDKLVEIKGKLSSDITKKNNNEIIFLHEGSISLDGQTYELTGDNFADVSESILYAKSSPIPLKNGVLVEGGASILSNGDINLIAYTEQYLENEKESISKKVYTSKSVFITNKGTTIEYTSSFFKKIDDTMRISPIKLDIDDISFTICQQQTISCNFLETNEGELIVYPSDLGGITIKTKDGVYKNIIVKEVGRYDSLSLTLTTSDNKEAKIVFTEENPPVARGKLVGLKSNIIHKWYNREINEKVLWMIYNGKPTVDSVGETNEEFIAKIIALKESGEDEQLDLLLKLGVNLAGGFGEDQEGVKLLRSKPGDIEFEKKIIKASITFPFESDKLLEIIHEYAPKDDKEQLQLELLNEVDKVTSNQLNDAFYNSESKKVKEAVLAKNKNIIMSHLKRLIDDNPDIKEELLNKEIVFEQEAKTLNEMILQLYVPHYKPDDVESFLGLMKTLKPDEQEKVITHINYETGQFEENSNLKGIYLRSILDFLQENNPSLFKKALEKTMPNMKDIGFEPKKLSEVYFSKSFAENLKNFEKERGSKLSFANKYSLALSTQRFLEQLEGSITENKIKDVSGMIISYQKEFEKAKISDENTNFLQITHEDAGFDNTKYLKLFRDSEGKQVVGDFKGENDKDKFREAIRESGDKEMFIVFNGHGGPEHLWLSSGEPGKQRSNSLEQPNAISWKELANDVIESGHGMGKKFVFDACYTYDFMQKFQNELIEKGIKTGKLKSMPDVIITSTNRGQPGLGGTSESISAHNSKGKPLTGKILNNAEGETFVQQDRSVTVPINEKISGAILKKYKFKTTPATVNMGSSYDKEIHLPQQPSTQTPQPIEEKKGLSKPLTIEIGKIEPAQASMVG